MGIVVGGFWWWKWLDSKKGTHHVVPSTYTISGTITDGHLPMIRCSCMVNSKRNAKKCLI